MLQFLRKRFASCLLSCLTIASTTMLMPMQAAAQYYYPDQGCCAPTCCEDNCNDSCSNKSFWCSPGALLLGAAVLGAGAGAAVSAGMNNGSSHHHDDDNGNPFVLDPGNTLSFSVVLDVSLVLLGGTAIPYVSTPDGRVIEGPPVNITLLGIINFPPIVVDNIVYGTYTVGVQTLANVNLTLAPFATVTASRDGSVTTVGLITPSLSLTGQSQVSGEFTYGPVNIP